MPFGSLPCFPRYLCTNYCKSARDPSLPWTGWELASVKAEEIHEALESWTWRCVADEEAVATFPTATSRPRVPCSRSGRRPTAPETTRPRPNAHFRFRSTTMIELSLPSFMFFLLSLTLLVFFCCPVAQSVSQCSSRSWLEGEQDSQ